jgi:hypothetical protein
MKEIDQRFLTFNGRLQLIKDALPGLDLAQQMTLEILIGKAFFAGWDFGVERYKHHFNEALK